MSPRDVDDNYDYYYYYISGIRYDREENKLA